jgi:ribosome-associated toxin RatA of RatAB toxin-antitoxin module
MTSGSFSLVLTAGGRASARRLLACGLAAAVLLAGARAVAAGATSGPAEGDRPQNLTVVEANGVYTISARFSVPVTPAIVLSVLTDYDGIPRFLPNVKSSRLLERNDRHVLVEQQAVVKLMFFSTRIHLLLGIDEGTRSLRFVDRSGKSFSRYEGVWTVQEQEEGGVEITYALTAEPAFEAPGFVVRRLMHRDASDQIERIQKEMIARAQEGSGH